MQVEKKGRIMLVPKIIIFGVMIFVAIHTYSSIYFGYCVKLKDDFYICYNGDYQGIEDHYHKVLAQDMDLSSADRLNFDEDYIFGIRHKPHNQLSSDNNDGDNEYFVVDLKNNKLYASHSIEQISEQCGITPEKFEALYPVSRYFHYYRFFGEIL